MSSRSKEERYLLILQMIRDQQKMSIVDLSRELGVSAITIRRDLKDLVDRGMVHRIYGGAIIAQSTPIDSPILQRLNEDKEIKTKIGQAAAALIQDGETVFIGSGSTTTYVAKQLVNRKGITVITNALNVGMELAASEGVTVVVVGGMLRPSELSLIGHIADQALRELRVDKVIMGIQAISTYSGLSNDYLPEVMTDRAIFAMAQEVILVADNTKFEKVETGYVAPINGIKTLITDNKTDANVLKQIRDLGINIIVTGEDPLTHDGTAPKRI
jgi:DeoR/GlpR family transcriptional regulator of sugar metabolism